VLSWLVLYTELVNGVVDDRREETSERDEQGGDVHILLHHFLGRLTKLCTAVVLREQSEEKISPVGKRVAREVQYSIRAVKYSTRAVQYSTRAVQYNTRAVQYSTRAVQYSKSVYGNDKSCEIFKG
jgi:hypothetical protein